MEKVAVARYSHILWDWNGTLLDDVDWCIQVMNGMLARRGMKTLDSIAQYHEAFCFPVTDYYNNLGFDFSVEPFEALAKEFIVAYNTGRWKLYEGAKDVLRSIQVPQIVLSASEIGALRMQMAELHAAPFFEEALGIGDFYAAGKMGLAREFAARTCVERALLIGDTEHDFEVARALGFDCVLIAKGHQSRARLSACGVPVLGDIAEVLAYIRA